MARRVTTATLPAEVEAVFEIVGDIPGGPRIALPHYGIGEVDFSKISLADAELLAGRGFPHLRRRATPIQKKKSGEG